MQLSHHICTRNCSMKTTLITLTISLYFISLQAQMDVSTPHIGLTFKTESIDLGQVKRGEKREMVFEFTNDGIEDVEIELVSSCECTTIDYPRGVIKIGETHQLDVIFDSTEKEESETVDVDVILKNIDPGTESQIMHFLSYTFVLEQ